MRCGVVASSVLIVFFVNSSLRSISEGLIFIVYEAIYTELMPHPLQSIQFAYIAASCVQVKRYSWWRHQTFSALLDLCEGNSPVTGEFSSQRPMTLSFDIFFDLRPNKRLSKPSRHQLFETPSRSLWRHCNVHSDVQNSPLIVIYNDSWCTRYNIFPSLSDLWNWNLLQYLMSLRNCC